LEVKVTDAHGFPSKPNQGGREAAVVVEVNNLRKQTRSCKKSTEYFIWNELIQIPVSDGNCMIDVTVRQVTAISSLFMGRVRIAMNEVASFGDLGAMRRFTLYDENLQLDERGNGKLQLHMRWIFDQATEDERIRRANMKQGFFARLAAVFLNKKPAAKDDKDKDEDGKKEGGVEVPDAHGHDPSHGGLPPETWDMTPFELDCWFKEQARQRQIEVGELLQIPEEELEIPEGDYLIQCHIIELTDIKTLNSSGMADPLVVVELMGQKHRTRVMSQVSSAFFNETFYFSFNGLKKEQISEAHLKISVYDYH